MTLFNPYQAQLDYETNIVEVQYDGEFNEVEAIKYAKQSYPSIEGIVIYNYPPNMFMGFTNPGIIGLK
jgi:hypothetical protein